MKHLTVLLFFISQILLGQQLLKVDEKPFAYDSFIGIDGYQNNYFIKNRVLNKQGPDGKFVFNDLQLGKLTSVDILNPLKVILFYQDTNTVVFVDNRLNEIERINFNNLPDFLNVSAASNAGNNSLWIFNVDSQQLELYNYRSNLKTNISQPISGKIISQASNFNYCFILNENNLAAYNINGSLLKTIMVDGYEKIIQQDENIVALTQNQLYYFPDFTGKNSKNLGEAVKLEIPEIKIKDLQLTNEFLYIYDGKKLHTFKLILPKQN